MRRRSRRWRQRGIRSPAPARLVGRAGPSTATCGDGARLDVRVLEVDARDVGLDRAGQLLRPVADAHLDQLPAGGTLLRREAVVRRGRHLDRFRHRAVAAADGDFDRVRSSAGAGEQDLAVGLAGIPLDGEVPQAAARDRFQDGRRLLAAFDLDEDRWVVSPEASTHAGRSYRRRSPSRRPSPVACRVLQALRPPDGYPFAEPLEGPGRWWLDVERVLNARPVDVALELHLDRGLDGLALALRSGRENARLRPGGEVGREAEFAGVAVSVFNGAVDAEGVPGGVLPSSGRGDSDLSLAAREVSNVWS